MSKDLNIYVFTHKTPSFNIIEDETHIPVQVGAFYAKEDVCETKDNTLDNISEKNPLYSELTGIYWVWKNIGRDKYVGCEHYRRHFDLTEVEIKDILSNNEIILPRKYDLGTKSVEEFYGAVHNINDIKLCEDIIFDLYPEYKDSYKKYIKNGNLLYIANSFITTSDNFNNLCKFLFTIFFEFERRKGFTAIDEWKAYVKEANIQICPPDHKDNGLTWEDYQLRIFAFLAKRLLTLYVLHNFNGKIYETDLLRLDRQNKNMKTLLCCIGRRENDYIREFVEYYKALGITNICLYDNNYDGEEDFNDVIGDYISNGFVILKDYRNKKVCQLEAYDECYKKYGKEYDWIAFFDIDEFMFINSNKTLSEYLARSEFNEYDMIHINWLLFGDGGQTKSDGRGLLQRIVQPLDVNHATLYNFPDNFHCKSIIRGCLTEVKWDATPHTPSNNLKCCNSFGLPCDGNSPFIPYDYRNAGLRHFTTKTAEEYAEKVKRGFPDGNPTSKEKMIKIFFDRNEVTEEKVNIFKQELGIDMSYLLPHKFDGVKNKVIQIYSLCYDKKKFAFMDDEVVTPLQVGAANGTDVCELKDNTGDNISDKNFFYIENTGTYWIWKNIKDAKYKGQMQYRRPLEGVNGKTNFEDIFSKYKVITCEPFHHPSHKTPTEEQPMVIIADTVEQGYAFSNCIDDLYILEMVVDLFYPEYKESYKKYIKEGPNLYYSNGFIMKSEDYDRYCEFLFGCLEKYQQFVDVSTPQRLMERVQYNMTVGKYPKHTHPQMQTPEAIRWQMSIGGFLSERIWTLWLLHNFKEEEIYKTPYVKMEEGMYT